MAEKETPWHEGLTDKQRRFVEEYVVDFNATEAAIRAGYSENGAAQAGYRALRNVQIREALEERFRELAMSSDEALALLRKHAHNPDANVSLSAVDKILRAAGAYKDRLDLTSGNEPLQPIQVTIVNQPQEDDDGPGG